MRLSDLDAELQEMKNLVEAKPLQFDSWANDSFLFRYIEQYVNRFTDWRYNRQYSTIKRSKRVTRK